MSDQATKLTAKERSAMIEFKRCLADHFCMGTRRIVSMQRLENAGLVKRVTVNGMIADWTITETGKDWTP